MNVLSTILVSIASVAVTASSLIYIQSEYEVDTLNLSCHNDGVVELFKKLATEDIVEVMDKENLTYDISVSQQSINTQKKESTGSAKFVYSCNADIIMKVFNKDGEEIHDKTFSRDYKTFENDLGTYFWVSGVRKIIASDF